MSKALGRLLTFGPFTFDGEKLDLRRNGERVRIPDQAARTLAALLETPGAPVTREQLRSQLWPAGEVLDYDRSINRTVSELRSLLRDRSMKSIEVIETLPKRGYCFVAPVTEIVRDDQADATEEEPSPPAPAIQTIEPVVVTFPSAPPVPKRSLRHWKWGALLLLIAGVVIGTYTIWKARRPATLPVSIGLADFEATGDEASSLAENFRLNLADTMTHSPLLAVRSLHSFHHSANEENVVLERARKLGVQLMLFGDLKLENDRWHIHMELVRCSDGSHLKSLQYTGSREELPSLPDRVEQNLFERLQLYEKDTQRKPEHTASIPAYRSLLRGRTLFNQHTDDSLLQAVQAYQEAIRFDDKYARAYAGLAHTYFILSQHGLGDEAQYIEQAKSAATTALRLDPAEAEAHGVFGLTLLLKDWDFAGASAHINRAIELDPNHTVYRQWLAILYGEQGDFKRGLSEIDKIQAADPEWAPASVTEIYLAGSARQFDRAERAANRLLTQLPTWPIVHEQVAILYWNEGKYLQAISEWRRAAELDGNTARMGVEDRGAEAFRQGGVPAYAKVRLEAIATGQGVSHVSLDSNLPEWNAHAGNYQQALEELEKIVHARKPDALQIAANPAYIPLHNNARYQALLNEIYGATPNITNR